MRRFYDGLKLGLLREPFLLQGETQESDSKLRKDASTMNIWGYFIEVASILMFVSAYREARSRDFLEDHGTKKGKRYAVKMKAFAVGIRIFFGFILFVFGLRLFGVLQ